MMERAWPGVARFVRTLATLVFVIGLLAWLVLLRPSTLGGSATYVLVAGDSMLPTYGAGDLVVALPATELRSGAVVVYRIPPGEPGAGRLVIHRIVAGDGTTGYTTQGDHNGYLDPWHPGLGDVVGIPALVVPGIGPAIAWLRTPIVAGTIAAVIAMTWLAWSARILPARVEPKRETAAL